MNWTLAKSRTLGWLVSNGCETHTTKSTSDVSYVLTARGVERHSFENLVLYRTVGVGETPREIPPNPASPKVMTLSDSRVRRTEMTFAIGATRRRKTSLMMVEGCKD